LNQEWEKEPKRQRGAEEEGADVEAALGRSRSAGLATAAIGFRFRCVICSSGRLGRSRWDGHRRTAVAEAQTSWGLVRLV
jgi:hypothetical protein